MILVIVIKDKIEVIIKYNEDDKEYIKLFLISVLSLFLFTNLHMKKTVSGNIK